MNSNRRRWTRAIAAGVLALGLGFTGASGVARAQDDMGEDAPSEGRPLDGYFGTAILVGLALFIIGKSARR
jgi:hypothetical protein